MASCDINWSRVLTQCPVNHPTMRQAWGTPVKCNRDREPEHTPHVGWASVGNEPYGGEPFEVTW